MGLNKEELALRAKEHTKEVSTKYAELITNSIEKTKEYSVGVEITSKRTNAKNRVILEPIDSVTALLSHQEGKVGVLNFASYKRPGGKFLDGSKAQEECLCHESYLYNVLKEKQTYYEWNKRHKNLAQYLNRCLYTPDILFTRGEKKAFADVITCAAPNITPARKYGWDVSDLVNSNNLYNRIKFVLDIAEDNEIDTLILGAYGCGGAMCC